MKNLKDLYRTEDLYTGYKELDDALDELTEFRVIGKAQRRKIARRMKRLVKTSAFKKKVERSKRKIASVAKQKVKAKLAKQKVLDKFYPKLQKTRCTTKSTDRPKDTTKIWWYDKQTYH